MSVYPCRKERKLFDMYRQSAAHRPDKKEREEIERLKTEVSLLHEALIRDACGVKSLVYA